MSDLAVPRRWQVSDVVMLAMVAATVLVLPPLLKPQPWHAQFATQATALILAALPYLVAGALLGGAIQAFVPGRFLPWLAKRLGIFGVPGIAVLSAAVPVCECGSVAVARGLLAKGLPLPHAVAYLLAGPIMNPTVLLSTSAAFGGDWRYPVTRGVAAIVIASLIAGIIAATRNRWRWLRPGIEPLASLPSFSLAGARRVINTHDHSRVTTAGAALAPMQTENTRPITSTSAWLAWANISLEHFMDMAGWYVFGCLLASGGMTAVTYFHIDMAHWGRDPITGPIGMVAMAFGLSICAESDAFVAAALGKQISFAAIMAFLISGPMLDLKLMLMYQNIFTGRAVLRLAGIILLAVALAVAVITLFGITR